MNEQPNEIIEKNITVKRLITINEEPKYASSGSVGFDFRAINILKFYRYDKEQELSMLDIREVEGKTIVAIPPFSQVLFGTEERYVIPEGYEIQIRPRSGMSLKTGITVAFGTIDYDYRGEIGIIIMNQTPFYKSITMDERIAQGVLNKIEKISFINISKEEFENTKTERGSGGFESTGKH